MAMATTAGAGINQQLGGNHDLNRVEDKCSAL